MNIIMTWVLGPLASWVYDHIHGSSVVTCLVWRKSIHQYKIDMLSSPKHLEYMKPAIVIKVSR